ncbi:MAG TPA: hypothetical protein VGN20_19070 [Mucilaginibacter sp.]|jgi:hypothetical protein
MKRTLTFLILLFAFLRLSAAGDIDTINNALNNGELPLLILHPEKLMVWTKSNHTENPRPAISTFSTNILRSEDSPMLALHPERFIAWTKSNPVENPELPISPFTTNALKEGDLPLLVLHPEKYIVWTKPNGVEHSELPSSPFIKNASKDGDLPLLVLHPEKLGVMTPHTSSDSLKLPVVPFHPIVTLKPPTAAPHFQNFKKEIKVYGLDSLKSLVKTTTNDSLKALLFTEMANRYLYNDTISDKKTQTGYQTEALSYTMKALHLFSRYDDSTGLRMSYDNLAKVYFSQKKYVQAKWFILQSNSLSRAKNDVPNVIASLLTLSAIKSEINDDKLAMRDLDEALQLSITKHYPKIELDVLKNYALYYSRLQNYPKEALMLKKRDSLQENIRKKEEAALLAKIALQDSIQKKKVDSLNKKKVYTSNTRKLYKSASAKKMASL